MKSEPGLPASGERRTLGLSYGGRAIELHRFGGGRKAQLLIGGVHGDEVEGFLLAEAMIEFIHGGKAILPEDSSVYILPRLNPDGCAAVRRTNQRNVDLNRNLPTSDWSGEFNNVRYYPGSSAGSETENVILMRLLSDLRPERIISLHSWENAMVNWNGPSEDLAIAMSSRNGLPPKGDIGYPTPGSLGTYAGWERGIPTITLEILRGQAADETWRQHHEALLLGLGMQH